MTYQTITTETSQNVVTIWLNRPEVQNAINLTMLKELTHVFQAIDKTKEIRLTILRGRGKSFCAGADLNWMKSSGKANYTQNYTESLILANCFNQIYNHSKPVIAVAHGAVIGGGCGLTSAADMVLATTEAQFSFSEVRLGLVPSTIMPYILQRVPKHRAAKLMFTAARISATEGLAEGLANEICEADQLEERLQWLSVEILKGGPEAIKECKRLLQEVSGEPINKKMIKRTAQSIADLKRNAESQEGMSAFLEKRKPDWNL